MGVSSLPPEIWLLIFDFATYTPKSLEPDILSFSFDFHGLKESSSMRNLRELEQALATKLAVVRVCRQWRALSMHLLYQCIMLRGKDDITLLLDTFSAYEMTGDLPLRLLVKRLDVAYRRHVLPHTEMGLLSTLLKRLPNLTVLHICPWLSHATIYTDDVIDALVNTCGHSLKVLHVSKGAIHFNDRGLAMILRLVPSLRVLVLDTSGHHRGRVSWSLLDGFECDKLAVLEVASPSLTKLLTSVSMPSLRQLILAKSTGSIEYNQLLKVHGQKLTKLSLSVGLEQETIDILKDVCPHLRILELRFHTWSSPVNPRTVVLPPIEELWLNGADESDQVIKGLRFISDYLARGAQPLQLKAVRINDAHTAEWLRSPGSFRDRDVHRLEQWRARLPGLLFDHDGLPL